MTASRETSRAAGSVVRRDRMSSSSTTAVSRSTCAMAMPASSLTTSASSVSAISSRRMSKAVSGVWSWCEASEAKSRSAASDLASCWALRDRTLETRSISAMPLVTGVSFVSPRPSRSAVTARSFSGRAKAWDSR